jgi:hypothetical protein
MLVNENRMVSAEGARFEAIHSKSEETPPTPYFSRRISQIPESLRD